MVTGSHNPKEYLGKFWVDCITHDPAMLEYILKTAGTDKRKEGSSAVKVNKNSADLLVVDREWVTTEWTLAKALKTYRFWSLFFMSLLLLVLM